jgi:hypothetical protein
MSQLERRLKKLEGRLTDESRFIPHSPQWRTPWGREIEKIVIGKRTPGVLIPLEAFGALADGVVDAHRESST